MYDRQKLIFLETAFLLVILSIIITMMIGTKSVVYAAEFAAAAGSHVFNINDFRINNFGIDSDRNLFLNVIGQAGSSKPNNSEQLFTYLFFTNNGIYAVSVSEEPSSIDSAAKITLDRNNCITSSHDIGKTDVHGNTIRIVNIPASSASALAIHKVETVQFNIDDTGTCIVKVFDSIRR